jgi:predicted esterase
MTGGGGTSPSAQYLPKVTGTCPTIAGANGSMLTFAGMPVQTWGASGKSGGSVVMYWYYTGGNSTNVISEFGQAQIDAVVAGGGVVASFARSKGTGTNTGDLVWYTDDFLTADEVVACAIQELHIDTRRIFTTGGSAGALQAAWMSYSRSGYIAAAAPISGGVVAPPQVQDPSNVPAAMAIHGAAGSDVVVIDFANASATWEADVKKRGGFAMDCNTGGGHISGPPQICPAIWQFFQDHPFKVSPQPYPPLPAVFPSYCKVM